MAWDQEFEHELGSAIRARIAPGAMTVIAAWPEPAALAAPRLRSIVKALERHGIARGRQLLMIADLSLPAGAGPPFRAMGGAAGTRAASGEPIPPAARARALGESRGVTALAHDRERSTCFVAGRTAGGIRFEVNDEFREAEALVMASPQRAMGTVMTLTELGLGFVSAGSLEAVRGALLANLETLSLLHPSVSVIWRAGGSASALMGTGAEPNPARES